MKTGRPPAGWTDARWWRGFGSGGREIESAPSRSGRIGRIPRGEGPPDSLTGLKLLILREEVLEMVLKGPQRHLGGGGLLVEAVAILSSGLAEGVQLRAQFIQKRAGKGKVIPELPNAPLRHVLGSRFLAHGRASMHEGMR